MLLALEVAAVWSDELDDDDDKLPPDSEDMLEASASDVLVLTIAMLSSSILLLAALLFVGMKDDWTIGGVIFVSATVALLLRVDPALLVLVDLLDELRLINLCV